MAVHERSTEAFVERAFADLAACYGGVMVSTGHKEAGFRSIRVAHETPFNIVLEARS